MENNSDDDLRPVKADERLQLEQLIQAWDVDAHDEKHCAEEEGINEQAIPENSRLEDTGFHRATEECVRDLNHAEYHEGQGLQAIKRNLLHVNADEEHGERNESHTKSLDQQNNGGRFREHSFFWDFAVFGT